MPTSHSRIMRLIRNGHLMLWLALCLGLLGWIVNPGPYISDDSYFYPVIARNMALHGEQSFSRLIPTNGFHPLWLYLLAGYSAIVGSVNPGLLFTTGYAIPLVALTTLVGMVVWMRVAREYGLQPGLGVGIPLSYLLLVGVLYSEAHLFYLCLGALFLVVARVRTRPMGLIWIGGMGGLTILARLDAVFVVLVAFASVAIERQPVLKRFIALALGASILLVPYLVVNTVFFGGLMPISGWMKSSFPEIFLKGIDLRGTSTTLFGYGIMAGILPLIAGAVLFRWRASPAMSRSQVLLPLLLGSALHFAYIALFTRSHTAWYWYYVTNTTLLGLSAAAFFDRVRGGSVAAWLLIPLLAGNDFVRAHEDKAVPEESATLRLIEQSSVGEGTVLVSDWPGYPAFHSRAKVLAADLLTANRNYYADMRSSPNALEFMFDHARASGLPIKVIICSGAGWLVPSKDRRSFTYNDPRRYPVPSAIGWMTVGDPDRSDGLATLWQVTDSLVLGAKPR